MLGMSTSFSPYYNHGLHYIAACERRIHDGGDALKLLLLVGSRNTACCFVMKYSIIRLRANPTKPVYAHSESTPLLLHNLMQPKEAVRISTIAISRFNSSKA